MTAPRWKLLSEHYLLLADPAKWEYKELDRATGKNVRKTWDVPTLLNPYDPGDWNHKNGDEGEIIVTNGLDPENGRDIIFKGDPTPDMLPLNAEAEAISAKFAQRWKHPIDSLPGNFSESLLTDLQRQVAEVQSKPTSSAPVEGMTELLTAMSQMMKQNQELLAALVTKPAPAEGRRL